MAAADGQALGVADGRLAAGVYVVQATVTAAGGTRQFHRTLTVVR